MARLARRNALVDTDVPVVNTTPYLSLQFSGGLVAVLADRRRRGVISRSSLKTNIYPPLPCSEETFIHSAIRELQTDPEVINKMYEKFSQRIITDMKRKVNRPSTTSSVQRPKDSTTRRGSASEATATSATTAAANRRHGQVVAPTSNQLEPPIPDLPRKLSTKSATWKVAQRRMARRESSCSTNLFNLFLRNKKPHNFISQRFQPLTARQDRANAQAAITAQSIKSMWSLRTGIVKERHDMNASIRAQSVFPVSRL